MRSSSMSALLELSFRYRHELFMRLQRKPIFCRLVSLYNQFKGSPKYFSSPSARCKIVPFNDFNEHEHWLVERWWAKQERVALGIEKELSVMTLDEFKEKVKDISEKINTIQQEIEALK